MPTSERGAAPENVRTRFKDRVRQWREDAILEAVAELLADEGCLGLTMDDVARRVGIAKGSLYLHTSTRSDLVSQLLDLWEEEALQPAPEAIGTEAELLGHVCTALFREMERGGHAGLAAFPCCLRASPCPHGWPARWARIAGAHGLGAMKDVELIGAAMQALAATELVRALLGVGKASEARSIVHRFLVGYSSSAVEAAS